MKRLIRQLIKEVLLAEALTSVESLLLHSGEECQYASDKHSDDLKRRISELQHWRNLEKRGSEARASYSRLIYRLKGELKRVERINASLNC